MEKSILPGLMQRHVDKVFFFFVFLFFFLNRAAPLKACSKFLLNGSLFNFTLILLFRSKFNILKFPACLCKQAEGACWGKGVGMSVFASTLGPRAKHFTVIRF